MLLQSPIATPADKTENGDQTCLPGMMPYMTQQHVQILLSCLDLSYDAAIQFDSRPGLKFLIQKVAGMDRAANLYRQAGAAWILKVVTLFDLSLHELRKTGATLDCVKRIIEYEDSKLKQELDKAKKSPENNKGDSMMETPTADDGSECDNDMTTFLLRLRQSFDKLCDTYIDVVLDKDGAHSAVDRISDQPIFFLIAQTDDFPEIKWNDSSESLVNNFESIIVNDEPLSNKFETKTDQNEHEKLNQHEENTEIGETESDMPVSDRISKAKNKEYKKPFKFADLANQYNDSASEGEPETTSQTKSTENDESVYNVSGGNDMDGLMEEYKRRKQMCALPLLSQGEKRKNPFLQRKTSVDPPLVPSDPLPPEIELQRKNSIFKVCGSYTIICVTIVTISIHKQQTRLCGETSVLGANNFPWLKQNHETLRFLSKSLVF